MAKIKSLNPATTEVLAEIEVTDEEGIKKAVERGREAGRSWGSLSFRERGAYILKAREEIRSRMDEIARLISKENGKPLTESISADILPVMDLMTWFAKNTERLLRRQRIWLGKWSFMGRTSSIEYFPLGVVGIIAPWNYPFSIPGGKTVIALMAGNAVVLKPSEYTPLVGLKIGEIFESVGLPKGVLQVIPGDGSTGAALVSAGVNKIVFTGSVATGKRIMEAAAKTLTPVVLELGGKDPMVVLEDADIDVATSGAIWGAFSNAGQTCSSVERLYVHEKIAPAFIQRLVEKTSQLRQGNGQEEGVEIGSMTSGMQLTKVERQVEAAKREGARVLCGGEKISKKGFFYRPTILANVNHTMEVMREETFGPVIGVMTFRNDEEAIRLANDCRYGLTASVWTRDIQRGLKIARKIEAGTVMVNENLYTYALAQTPWGGPKETGIGRTHGKIGLLEMVEPKHIHVNRITRIKDFWWYTYDQTKYSLLVSLANTLFSRNLFQKVKSALRFLWLQLKVRNI